LLVSLEKSGIFLKAAKNINTISYNEVAKAYKQFLEKLEKFHFVSHSGKQQDSLGMIEQFFADVEF